MFLKEWQERGFQSFLIYGMNCPFANEILWGGHHKGEDRLITEQKSKEIWVEKY